MHYAILYVLHVIKERSTLKRVQLLLPELELKIIRAQRQQLYSYSKLVYGGSAVSSTVCCLYFVVDFVQFIKETCIY